MGLEIHLSYLAKCLVLPCCSCSLLCLFAIKHSPRLSFHSSDFPSPFPHRIYHSPASSPVFLTLFRSSPTPHPVASSTHNPSPSISISPYIPFVAAFIRTGLYSYILCIYYKFTYSWCVFVLCSCDRVLCLRSSR